MNRDKFQAKMDMDILRQAQEIISDPKRLKAAKNQAAKQKQGLEKVETFGLRK